MLWFSLFVLICDLLINTFETEIKKLKTYINITWIKILFFLIYNDIECNKNWGCDLLCHVFNVYKREVPMRGSRDETRVTRWHYIIQYRVHSI